MVTRVGLRYSRGILGFEHVTSVAGWGILYLYYGEQGHPRRRRRPRRRRLLAAVATHPLVLGVDPAPGNLDVLVKLLRSSFITKGTLKHSGEIHKRLSGASDRERAGTCWQGR